MSHHHKSGTQKRKEKAVRVEGVKGQKTLEQHGFDVAEDSEGTDRERNQCSSLPSAEAMTSPSESGPELLVGLSESLEILEEVP